uniref:Uncharacterized protein n=1 Tax=Janibacter limosus TaxID=53458 RepID=A0AC61U3H7_9MICO|nr:hypothetical protein [Janibacter limosus]
MEPHLVALDVDGTILTHDGELRAATPRRDPRGRRGGPPHRHLDRAIGRRHDTRPGDARPVPRVGRLLQRRRHPRAGSR